MMSEQTDTGSVEDVGIALASSSGNGSTGTIGAGEWVSFDGDDDGYAEILTRAFDGGFEVLVDADLDGTADDAWAADSTGDGVVDVQILRTGGTYLVRYDADADGIFEHEREMTLDDLSREAPHIAELLGTPPSTDSTGDPAQGAPQGDPTVVEPAPGDLDGNPSPSPDGYVVDGQLVGDPVDAAEHWFQQATNGFCVPASVAQIVAEYTGIAFVDELDFVALANEMHLFTVGPDGEPSMTQHGALRLLQAAGVPADLVYANTSSLEGYLAEGRGVMAFVDSGELWYGEDVEDDTVDHAVLVTGVDTERGVVYLSDPGDPDGNAREYPLELFEDAWADGGGQAVVCDEPAPDDDVSSSPGSDSGFPDAAPDATTPSFVAEVLDRRDRTADEDRTGELLPVQEAVSGLVERAWALLPVVLRGAAASR